MNLRKANVHSMCGCMNTIYTRWEGFVPETSIEKALHKHIENFA